MCSWNVKSDIFNNYTGLCAFEVPHGGEFATPIPTKNAANRTNTPCLFLVARFSRETIRWFLQNNNLPSSKSLYIQQTNWRKQSNDLIDRDTKDYIEVTVYAYIIHVLNLSVHIV